MLTFLLGRIVRLTMQEADYTANRSYSKGGGDITFVWAAAVHLKMFVAFILCLYHFVSIFAFYCRYLQPNQIHNASNTAAVAEEARSVIRAASRSARNNDTEGHCRGVAQEQNISLGPSLVALSP